MLLLPYALVSTYGFDAAYYHLYVPKYVFLFNQFHFDPVKHWWALNPAILGQGVFTTAYRSECYC